MGRARTFACEYMYFDHRGTYVVAVVVMFYVLVVFSSFSNVLQIIWKRL
jgi:hypothetical protein